MAISAAALTAIIGGATAAATTATNAGVTAGQNKAARKWQAEQAEINRQWQEEQTEKANQWSRDMWNEMASPQATIQNMREAGINPLYSGLEGTAPNLTPATVNGVGNPSYSPIPFQMDPNVASDVALKAAQANKLEAEADDIRGYASTKIKLGETEIALKASEIGKTEAETEKIATDINATNNAIDLAIKQNEREDKKLSLEERKQKFEESKFEIEKQWKEKEFSLEEKKLYVDYLNYVIAARVADSQVAVNNAYAVKLDEEGNLVRTKNKIVEKDLENYDKILKQNMRNQKVENVSKVWNSVNGSLNAVANIVFAVGNLSSVVSGSMNSGTTVNNNPIQNDNRVDYVREDGIFNDGSSMGASLTNPTYSVPMN